MGRGFISHYDDHGEAMRLTTNFQLGTVFEWVVVAKYDNYLLIVGLCVPYYHHQSRVGSGNFPASNLIDQIPGRSMDEWKITVIDSNLKSNGN